MLMDDGQSPLHFGHAWHLRKHPQESSYIFGIVPDSWCRLSVTKGLCQFQAALFCGDTAVMLQLVGP